MNQCPTEVSYVASPEGYTFILHILTCLEIPVHLLGAYCILFKTPRRMQSVKWLILNLHFWSALEDIYTSLVFTPFVLFPVMSGWGLGFEFYPVIGIYLFVTFLAAVASAIVLIYENRSFVLFIQNKSHFWCRHRLKFLVVNNVLVLFYFSPPYLTIPEQKKAVDIINRSVDCLMHITFLNRKQYVLTMDHSLVFWCLVIVLFIFTSQIVALTIHLAYNLLTRTTTSISQQTQKMQRNLVFALAVQTTVPIMVIVVPVHVILYSIHFWDYNQTRNNLIFIALSVHGLISTFVMIFIHKPYRRFVLSPIYYVLDAVKERRNRNEQRIWNVKQPNASTSRN